MRWRHRIAILAAIVVLVVSVTGGSYLAASRASQTSKQVANLQLTANGVQQLLAFVASVQNGPQAKASRDATAWYLKQIRAICIATPGCHEVPLPPGLSALIGP